MYYSDDKTCYIYPYIQTIRHITNANEYIDLWNNNIEHLYFYIRLINIWLTVTMQWWVSFMSWNRRTTFSKQQPSVYQPKIDLRRTPRCTLIVQSYNTISTINNKHNKTINDYIDLWNINVEDLYCYIGLMSVFNYPRSTDGDIFQSSVGLCYYDLMRIAVLFTLKRRGWWSLIWNVF